MASYVGEIILVGFNFAPAGWAQCNGQLLPISEYETLFTLIGTTYGGDGVTTFALPDLRGRVPIHQGTGPSLSSHTIGENGGAESVTLTTNQIPVHTHVINSSLLTITARAKNGIANQATPQGGVPAIENWVTTYTDPSLTAGSSTVKGAHVIELRSRIEALRGKYNLAAFSYTDPALTVGATLIKAQHVMDLRSALSGVYTAAGLSQPTYTDPVVSAGAPFRAVYITELRNAVVALGSVTALPYSNAAPDQNMGASIVLGGSVTAAATGGTGPHDNMQPYLGLNYCISLFGVFPPQG